MLTENPSDARLLAWLDQRGLWGNPFAIWNAERDPNLPGYFVDVGQFDELLHWAGPCIVFAGRGCGKTAQRQMLAAHCRPQQAGSSDLAVPYTYAGFERALAAAGDEPERLQPAHHVAALLQEALRALMEATRQDAELAAAVQRPDIAFRISTLTIRHAPHFAPVMGVQAPTPQRDLSALQQLTEFLEVTLACGLEKLLFLVDGLDEFPLTASDPRRLAAFLAPLLGTLALIECPGTAFRFFLPAELEPLLRQQPWFRPDRLRIFRIAWTDAALRSLISQRLAFFSKRGGRTYTQLGELCSEELAARIDKELVRLGGGQPRATLALADRLLRIHCLASESPGLITPEAWAAIQAQRPGLAADFHVPRPPTPPVGVTMAETPLLVVDEETGRVHLGERDITTQIRAQDYRVLACLYRHRGDVCEKERLIAEAWPDAEQGEGVSDQAIAAAIARLRKNLGQRSPERGYIETVKGRGYRLHPEGFVTG